MTPSRVVARLEEIREEIGYSRKRIAGQLKPKRTRQAVDAALSQRSRLTVQDAEAIAEMLGVRLEVVVPASAANALRRALDGDAELDERWREIVWAAYQHARAQSARGPGRERGDGPHPEIDRAAGRGGMMRPDHSSTKEGTPC